MIAFAVVEEADGWSGGGVDDPEWRLTVVSKGFALER